MFLFELNKFWIVIEQYFNVNSLSNLSIKYLNIIDNKLSFLPIISFISSIIFVTVLVIWERVLGTSKIVLKITFNKFISFSFINSAIQLKLYNIPSNFDQ